MRTKTDRAQTRKKGQIVEVNRTPIEGVFLIKPPTAFEDFRGSYVEIYNEALYRDAGIAVDFKQDDISVSSRHVLRGIHGDQKTWKLVSCLSGRFYLVVVNWDESSPQYRGLDVICSIRIQQAAGADSTQIRERPRGGERSGHFSLQTVDLL